MIYFSCALYFYTHLLLHRIFYRVCAFATHFFIVSALFATYFLYRICAFAMFFLSSTFLDRT